MFSNRLMSFFSFPFFINKCDKIKTKFLALNLFRLWNDRRLKSFPKFKQQPGKAPNTMHIVCNEIFVLCIFLYTKLLAVVCRYCELPVECRGCGLTLVSAPHLARSYHHLFPLPIFKVSDWILNLNFECYKFKKKLQNGTSRGSWEKYLGRGRISCKALKNYLSGIPPP